MATEWDAICSDLAVLLEDKRDAEYKKLCVGTLLIHILSVVEHRLEASPRNIRGLRELLKEHDPEYYELLPPPQGGALPLKIDDGRPPKSSTSDT